MQSYFQRRRIYKKLQKQLVTNHVDSQYISTHERRYCYLPGGGLSPESRDPQESAAAQRWLEHGNRTWVGGPAFEAHTARSHMDRDGDVERADMDPEFNVDPYTINSRDTIGSEVDIVVTGVERARYAEQGVNGGFEGVEYGAPRVDADAVVADTAVEEDKQNIIVVSYEGDIDPMDPHNWSFVRRFACTTLVSWIGALALWSSTIDPTALTETTKVFHTTFEVQSLPTGKPRCPQIFREQKTDKARPRLLFDSSRIWRHFDWACLRSSWPESRLYRLSDAVCYLRFGCSHSPKPAPANYMSGLGWALCFWSVGMLSSDSR